MESEFLKKRRYWKRWLKISLAAFLIPPLIGMLVTAFTMVESFQSLSENTPESPEALASGISLSMTLTAIGLVISAIVFPFLIFCLVRFMKVKP